MALRHLITAGLLAIASCAHSAQIDARQAVRAILGEASGQPYQAQLAVACAIRNRGSLSGIFGVSNPVVSRATESMINTARRAWEQSAKLDITGGLKFFGCSSDSHYFKALGMRKAFKIGSITFWSET